MSKSVEIKMELPSRRVSVPSEPHTSPLRPYQKKNRLNIACTQCRRQKVRCDASLPRCRNCRLRGDKCETLDVREIDQRGIGRAKAVMNGSEAGDGSENSVDDINGLPKDKQARLRGGSSYSRRKKAQKAEDEKLPSRALKRKATQIDDEPDAPAAATDVSWVSQAYRASAVESHCVASTISGSTRDVVLNMDKSSMRTKFLGGSSVQSLCNFVDLHLAAIGFEPIGGRFNDGMQHSEEFSVPLLMNVSEIPVLPPRGEISIYVNRFLKCVWPLFPVVDPVALEVDISHLLTLQAAYAGDFLQHLSPLHMTHLAMAYAVVCTGYDELNGRVTETSTRCLTTAYSLYAQLVGLPYVSSVQAFILLSLVFRGQVKEGQAWQTLGQAIRIAHSIGLHKRAEQVSRASGMNREVARIMGTQSLMSPLSEKPTMRESATSETEILHSRIWYLCCALERVMQLESGRPSQLDGDHDFATRKLLSSGVISALFASWLSLTAIMGRVATQVYFKRPATLLELLHRVQELDQALIDW